MAKRKASAEAGDAAIVWFRNDLRLADNEALLAASDGGRRVLPVFVFDGEAAGRWALGGASRWWLHGSLGAFGASLAEQGAPLVLRRGDAASIIPELAEQVGAAEVHCGQAHEPAVRALDERVGAALAAAGRTLVTHRTATLRPFGEIHTKTGGDYGIYSPFAKAARALGEPGKPHGAPKTLAGVDGVKSDTLDGWGLLPDKPDWAGGMRDTWTPGEAGAHDRMTRFIHDHLEAYADERDNPGNPDGTSMLSPHLHWGELSPNQVWHAVGHGHAKGREKFENEVLWHEFAAHVLWNDSELPDRPQRPSMAALPWRRDREALTAWQRGQTGIPIVDAGMRQLWQIGWMHNRVRMITASFLIKHALVDWTEGEAWFWDTLVDADLATNAMSWQWVAGSGTDSAPFFRIFNPVSQSKRFDPGGGYIRTYVPELARLSDRDIHAPHELATGALDQAGITLGRTYPHPVVDLAEGRDRALEAFRKTHGKKEKAP